MSAVASWLGWPVQNTRSTARGAPLVSAAMVRLCRSARLSPWPTGEHGWKAYTQYGVAAHDTTPSWLGPPLGAIGHGSSSIDSAGPQGAPTRCIPMSQRD